MSYFYLRKRNFSNERKEGEGKGQELEKRGILL
jgi:hypothetical protein